MKFLPWLTSVIGSYIGWAFGARVGTVTAFILSIVGAGIGMYFGRKWVLENL